MYQRQYTPHEWVKFAFAACFLFGIGNYLISLLGAKYGSVGILPLCFGQFFCCAFYHASVKNETFYMDKIDGPKRIIGLLLRASNHLASIWLNIMSFTYAERAHINQGVIAGLYASGIVFTAIIFYFVYRERISIPSLLGMAMIIAGVFCVSFKLDDSVEIDYDMLIVACIFGITTGFSFATNALIVKHFIKAAGFTPIQLSVDCIAVSGCLMLVMFMMTET